MVSIIPGIETLAPDLTESKRGFFRSPNFFLTSFSITFNSVLICFINFEFNFFLSLKKISHTFVEIVNPGGTGSPILPISDKLAPLPPKKFLGFLIFFESLDVKFKINLFIISL